MRFELFSKLMSENTKNGIYKSKDFMGTGIPIVKMSQQFGNRFIDSSLDGYEQIILDDKELEGYRLLENDLLFSRTSVVPEGVGMCSIIREKERDLVFESNIIRVRLNNYLVNPEFVFRYFQSPKGRGSVLSIAGGTNIKTIKASSLKDLKVPLLDRNAQNNVVEILRNYDDLIENNRRRIQLLEESARLLYQEWFVHLRFPGHEQVKITDGVPEGWEKRHLIEIADILMGQSPKSEFYNDTGDGLPFHQGVTNYGFRFVEHKIFCTKVTRLAEAGDILCSVRAPVGRLNITNDKMVLGRGLSAIRSKSGYQSFLFYALKSFFFKEDILGGGAIYAAVTKKDMETLQLLVPNEGLLDEFESMAKEIDAQIFILTKQNNQLTQARDLLLPKLMSGELTV